MMKLHLCCGDIYLRDHINCDITGKLVTTPVYSSTTLENYYQDREIGDKQQTYIDKRLNLLQFPWPFVTNSVNQVVMIQGIEHFTRDEAYPIIAQIHRILKPRGRLLIDFPDIEATVEKYIHSDPDFCMRFIYCSHKNKYSVHHWGYTKQTFAELLGSGFAYNFREIVHHDYPVIGCEATKL